MINEASVAGTPNTLQDELQAVRAQALRRRTRDFPIPGYGGRLWATFHAIGDFADVHQIYTDHADAADTAERLVLIAADVLIKSCDEVFAMKDGKKYPLGMRLGQQLAMYLGEAVENDRQGVFAIFPDTLAIMALFGEIDTWIRGVEPEVNTETLGKSVAASA